MSGSVLLGVEGPTFKAIEIGWEGDGLITRVVSVSSCFLLGSFEAEESEKLLDYERDPGCLGRNRGFWRFFL